MKSEHDIPAAAKETVEDFLKKHPNVAAKFKSAASIEFKRVAMR